MLIVYNMYARQLGSGQEGGGNYFYPVREFAENNMNEYIQPQYINPNLQEVNPQSFQSNTDFANQGILDFIVDTSNTYGIIWSRSFIRADISLNTLDSSGNYKLIPTQSIYTSGANSAAIKDDVGFFTKPIAFSRFVGGNMWQGASMSISNQMIEQTTQYTQQLNAVNCRLGYSGDFLRNNSDLLYSEPSIIKRINKISQSNNEVFDTFKMVPNNIMSRFKTIDNLSIVWSNALDVSADSKLTITVINDDYIPTWAELNITSGDSLILNTDSGANYIVYVGQLLSGTTAIPTDEKGNRIHADTNDCVFSQFPISIVKRTCFNNVVNLNQNKITVLYQPPLGLFNVNTPLCGSFKLSLNPSSTCNIDMIQSLNANETGYKVNVDNVRLYCCVCRQMFSPERTLKLRLGDMAIYNRGLTSSQQSFEFTVPSSTRSIAVFFQSSLVGKSAATQLSPSEFLDLGGKTFNLLNLQTTYGSISIPSTAYTTQFNNYVTHGDDDEYRNILLYNPTDKTGNIGVNNKNGVYTNNQQTRYWDYMMTTGKIFDSSGPESFEEWAQSPIYVFDYSNSENSRATNLKVTYQLEKLESTNNVNMFVVAWYSKVVLAEYKQNIVTDLSVGDV